MSKNKREIQPSFEGEQRALVNSLISISGLLDRKNNPVEQSSALLKFTDRWFTIAIPDNQETLLLRKKLYSLAVGAISPFQEIYPKDTTALFPKFLFLDNSASDAYMPDSEQYAVPLFQHGAVAISTDRFIQKIAEANDSSELDLVFSHIYRSYWLHMVSIQRQHRSLDQRRLAIGYKTYIRYLSTKPVSTAESLYSRDTIYFEGLGFFRGIQDRDSKHIESDILEEQEFMRLFTWFSAILWYRNDLYQERIRSFEEYKRLIENPKYRDYVITHPTILKGKSKFQSKHVLIINQPGFIKPVVFDDQVADSVDSKVYRILDAISFLDMHTVSVIRDYITKPRSFYSVVKYSGLDKQTKGHLFHLSHLLNKLFHKQLEKGLNSLYANLLQKVQTQVDQQLNDAGFYE